MSIDLSPDEFRRLGYQVIDILAENLSTIHTDPTRQAMTDDLRQQIVHQPPPETPQEPDKLLDLFARTILPYPMGNGSPRFFAWVNSPAAPVAILAETLAAGMNPSVAGGDHAATYVEHAVLNWLKAIVGFPQTGAGLLTSGGSMANLVGLAVMRHAKASGQMRVDGFNTESAPMVVYTSEQGHMSIQKGVELLGIGRAYLRKIPVDSAYRMDVDALKAQIKADREAGLRPVCIAASAGTVNTGAIDSLDRLADICEVEDLWLHVDGAYGAVGILAEQTAGLYNGIERADSLALDPHKWLYMPVECGCVLVSDAQMMRDTFSLRPEYIRDDDLPWFAEFGPQQTRGFKALKLWMVMQQIGLDGYHQLISRDITLARMLQDKIRTRDDFELVAAGPLSVTCFRYAPPGVDDLDSFNRRIVAEIQRAGQVFLASTVLHGQTVLRACIVNFRTTEADLDMLLDEIARVGRTL